MTKYMKWIRRTLILVMLILSHGMCIHVAAGYTDLKWGMELGIYSGGPPALAFIYAIPYVIGIVICMILLHILRKKAASKSERNPYK